MKQINFFTILMLILLFTSCGSKTKHQVVASGTSTVDEVDMTTFTIDNDYSIMIPSIMKNKPEDPDRFSAEFQYVETDYDCEVGLSSMTFQGWIIYIESDTKEAYENRRKKEGNLEQYPFDLDGFSGIGLKGAKENKDTKSFRMISSEKATINGMPAIIDACEIDVNIVVVGDIRTRRISANIQATNGKLYRIQFALYPADELSDEIPEWIMSVCNSFKLV